MNDLTTFSGAEAELLERGFLLGFENTSKTDSDTKPQPFKIFIQPVNQVLITLEGRGDDEVFICQMMSVWKLKSDEDSRKFYLEMPCLDGTQPKTNHDDATPRYTLDINYQRSFDPTSLANMLIFYDLLVQYAEFLIWEKQPNLELLNFVEKLAQNRQIVASCESGKFDSTLWDMLNQHRLRFSVVRLGLDPINFGLN